MGSNALMTMYQTVATLSPGRTILSLDAYGAYT